MLLSDLHKVMIKYYYLYPLHKTINNVCMYVYKGIYLYSLIIKIKFMRVFDNLRSTCHMSALQHCNLKTSEAFS